MYRRLVLLILGLLLSSISCRSMQYTFAPAATFSVQPTGLSQQDEQTLQSIEQILEKRMTVGLKGNAKVVRENAIFKIIVLHKDDLDTARNLATSLGRLSFVDTNEAILIGSIVPQTNKVILTNEQLESAEWNESLSDTPQLIFYLNKDGETRFSDHTKLNVGRYIAIALDNVVIYCPQITMQISGNVFTIAGLDADKQLAFLIPGLLSASPLPISLEEVSNN